MAILYKPTKYAIHFKDDSLTEQEHLASCDINQMMKSAMRGANIRGSGRDPQYGEDDMNLSQLDVRIKKAALEEELNSIAQNAELEEEALKHIPKSVQEKFKFKIKKKQDKSKNDDEPKNDDDKKTPAPNTDPKP